MRRRVRIALDVAQLVFMGMIVYTQWKRDRGTA